MRYAVRLSDVFQDHALCIILSQVCPNKIAVQINKREIDNTALVLECPQEQVGAIVEVCRLRVSRERRRRPVRFYRQEKEGRAWKAIKQEEWMTDVPDR